MPWKKMGGQLRTILSTSYRTFFVLQFIQRVVQRYQLKLLVYDEEDEVIVTWTK